MVQAQPVPNLVGPCRARGVRQLFHQVLVECGKHRPMITPRPKECLLQHRVELTPCPASAVGIPDAAAPMGGDVPGRPAGKPRKVRDGHHAHQMGIKVRILERPGFLERVNGWGPWDPSVGHPVCVQGRRREPKNFLRGDSGRHLQAGTLALPCPSVRMVSCSGPIAQWSEQGTHNPLVAGSSPAGPTNPPSPARHSQQGDAIIHSDPTTIRGAMERLASNTRWVALKSKTNEG